MLDEKQKKLIQRVRILSMAFATGIIFLSLQTAWTNVKIFEYAAWGLSVFALIIVTVLLRGIVRPDK